MYWKEGGRKKEGESYFLLSPSSFLLIFFFLLSSSLAQPSSTLFPYPWNDRSIFAQNLITESEGILEQLAGAPVYHLEWKLSDDLFKLDGKAEIFVTNTSSVPWNDLVFRLYPNALGSSMIVNSVLVDGLSVTPSLESENTALRIPLSQPLASTQSLVISIAYTLTVSETIEAYGRLARFENVLSLAHAYPTLGTLENNQWETDIPSPLGDPLVADAAFFIARVTAPNIYTLITTGQDINHTGTDNQQTIEYIAGPARDFYLAAMQHYTFLETMVGETKIRSFVPTRLAFSLQRSLSTTKQALEFFSTYYPYPYREFDVVAVPVQAGGVEYPGIVNITNGLYINPFGRLNTVIVHEAGHQWSFNLVGNDQIEDPWLDEALTQYLTLRYQETYENRFSQGYLDYWEQLWDTSQEPNTPIGLPVDSYNESSYGEIVYGKGLFFFEALAQKMGKSELDAALKSYFSNYAWKLAEPKDFQATLESSCSCDLSPLFTIWVNP